MSDLDDKEESLTTAERYLYENTLKPLLDKVKRLAGLEKKQREKNNE